MGERSGISLTCPSCLAQLLVEAGTGQSSITCFNCGDACPIPVEASAPAPAPAPASAVAAAPRPSVTCSTCLTVQSPPGDHGIFPCRHCGRLINTAPMVLDAAADAGPRVLPIPDSYHPQQGDHPPPGPSTTWTPPPTTPVDRAVTFVFNDVIGRNPITAACYGTAVLYAALVLLVVVACLPKHADIAAGAAEVLLPLAAVLAGLPWIITARFAANPEWIVIWAVGMVPVHIFLVIEGIFAAAVVPVLVLSVLILLKLVSGGQRR